MKIMNLLLLVPDIQEEILLLPRVLKGQDMITENHFRDVLKYVQWEEQTKIWGRNL